MVWQPLGRNGEFCEAVLRKRVRYGFPQYGNHGGSESGDGVLPADYPGNPLFGMQVDSVQEVRAVDILYSELYFHGGGM